MKRTMLALGSVNLVSTEPMDVLGDRIEAARGTAGMSGDSEQTIGSFAPPLVATTCAFDDGAIVAPARFNPLLIVAMWELEVTDANS